MSAPVAAVSILWTSLAAAGGVPVADDCVHRADAEAWLARQATLWQPRLAAEPGFRPLPNIAVCELHARRPYADTRRARIYAGALRTTDDAVTLAHEFLHLVLQDHPHGRDDRYVEALARELAGAKDSP